MNFSQCYYTSIGGWSAVGSAQLPESARQLFASDQAANAPRNQHYVDKDGKPLVLSEIISDGKQAVVSRCQYGLVDQRGRPNMFAHGYCHVWDKALTADPAPLCFVTPDSFAVSKEQVELEGQPNVAPLSGFAPAFCKTGLLWKHFAVLTLAVYAVFERQDASLYVLSGCEGEALQALTYCIYLSMPYSIRKALSFADASLPGAKPKTILFCKPGEVPQDAFYFSLLTGENNVVTKEWMARNKKNRFMRQFGSLNGDVRAQQYFAALDARLQQLGKPDAVSYRLLYLADTLMLMDEGKPLPADAQSLAYLMASVSVPNAAYLDGYLARIVQTLSEQNAPLHDALNEMILARMRATENPQLLELRMQFRRNALLTMPTEQAGEELLSMKDHAADSAFAKREFDEAQMFLFESDKGRQIIGCAVRGDYLQSEQKSYAALADAHDDCVQLNCAPEEIEAFTCGQAYELYCHAMNQGDALAAYRQYTAFLKERFAAAVVLKWQKQAKARYWELFDLSGFTPAKAAEYQELSDDSLSGCQKAKDYARVLQKLKTVSEDDAARLYLAMLQSGMLNDRERAFLVQQCRSACMEQDGTTAQGGSARIRLAYYLSRQPDGGSLLAQMNALGVSVSPQVWQILLQEAPCFFENGALNEEYVAKFIQAVQIEVQNTETASEKLLAQGILSAHQAIMGEKKQMEKLAVRAQKEEARQLKREQSSGFGGKLSAMMGHKEELTLQSDPSALARTQELPSVGDTMPQPEPPLEKLPEIEPEVIYSGRDLSQMHAPEIIEQDYERTEQPPKKKKWSDLLKWHK